MPAPSTATPRIFGICTNGGLTQVGGEGVKPDSISLHWFPAMFEEFGEPLVTRVRARQVFFSADTPVMAGGLAAYIVRVLLLRRSTVLLERFISCTR